MSHPLEASCVLARAEFYMHPADVALAADVEICKEEKCSAHPKNPAKHLVYWIMMF